MYLGSYLHMEMLLINWLTPCAGIHITQETILTYGDKQEKLQKQLWVRCSAETQSFHITLGSVH